jgi:hypothetical protein
MRTVAIMMLRRAALAALVLALAVALVPAGASAAHGARRPARKCGQAVSRLLLADGQAEVYEAPEELGEPTVLTVYGCAFQARRPRALGGVPAQQNVGGPSKESGVLLPTLAGAVVAYAETHFSPYNVSDEYVVVCDLVTGRVVHVVPTGVAVKPVPGQVGIGTVVALVVKGDGSVAWIVGTDPEDGTYQVHVVDGAGSRVLATGADIDPGSLALAGSTLYWTQGGQPRSATLE